MGQGAYPGARLPVVRGPRRPTPRPRRRWLPPLARLVAILALVAVVALGLLYVRLMYGPLAMSFLADPIEDAIARELAGARVHVHDVALSLDHRGLVQFELKNVRISASDGEPLVAAPSVAVSLSRTAMLSGRIAVESLDLTSARLVLFYADDGTLSLRFSPDTATAATAAEGSPTPSPGPSQARQEPSPSPPAGGDGLLGRIDLVKVLAEASARARRQEDAGAYLRGIGLRSATVIIDNGRRKSIWRVPELDVDLDHRRTRSTIVGRAKIQSHDGPWELTFRSYERVKAGTLRLAISVDGLVPRGLALAFPSLLALEGIDLPVSADAQVELSQTGDILNGRIAVDAASGDVALPGPNATPMHIGGGRIELTYDGTARRFTIGRSHLSWGEGLIKLAGSLAYTAQGADGPGWTFDIKGTEGWVAADPQAPMRLPIDELSAVGFLAPERRRITLERFVLRAGGAEASARGEIADAGSGVQARLEGRIGPMSVGLFKTLWPSWLAPQGRLWAAGKLKSGQVEGGTFKIVRGGAGAGSPMGADPDRFSLAIEGSSLELALMDGWPALEVPRALLNVEGSRVEVSIPQATQTAADGRAFSLKGAFSVDLSEPLPRRGRFTVKGRGPLSLAIDILKHEAPGALQNAGFSLDGSEGEVDGRLTIEVPLAPQPQAHNARVEGRLTIADAKVPQAVGKHDIQGINVAVDIAQDAFEAKGKFLVGNVPARLTWQHVYRAPPEKQPPLRISAVLFEAERTELGLDINDLVRGKVNADVTITQDAKGKPQVHLRADLGDAELAIESLGWRKPVGRRAVFEFDIVKGTDYPVELRNVRLDGEDVAIAGWMGLGENMQVREYRFPQFSLNVVSNFEAHGILRPDNVWQVTAKGPTYDGRDLFKSFFFVRTEKKDEDRPGLDLTAEFDTVLGFFQTSARSVRLSMQKRGGKLNKLEMNSLLTGGGQLTAVVHHRPGHPRQLIARSNDAGKVFKLVGFLPHAVGGNLHLEVDIDGRGPVERTGTLTATRFHLLGKAISVENLPDSAQHRGGRRVVREKIAFDRLRAPFKVGAGQFVVNNAGIDGPLMSATMSGRVDFRTRKLHMVGTFTPLSALNKILSDVPLVGDIVTGPNREGVFAWNYAVQGGLENPQVVVNPLSGVAPGFTRELFPILPQNPSPPPSRRGKRSDSATRASSALMTRPQATKGGSTNSGVSEDWPSNGNGRSP